MAAVRKGLRECVDAGTALLGAIATHQWPPDEPLLNQIQCVVLRELIGSRAVRLEQNLAIAQQHLEAAQQPSTLWQAGISPHAPYTISLELLQQVVRLSAEERVPLAMHLAESPEELQLLSSHCGPLVDLLTELGAWDPTAIPRGIAPRDLLERLERAHRTLVIHGNYLVRGDWDLLAAGADHMSVVYCPRTHAYFNSTPYPLGLMLRRGVRVCLGTDSRASNPDLNLYAELQHVARAHTDISPADVLHMATLAGAQALGCDQHSGSITPGKRAKLIAVPLPEHTAADPHELLIGMGPTHKDGLASVSLIPPGVPPNEL